MTSIVLRTRISRARVRFLLSAASVAGVTALLPSGASAAAAAAAPVEEILITGSLIRGAEAVGVPVVAVGDQEFEERAALSVSDVLRASPVVSVIESTAHGASGSNLGKNQRVSIHGQGGSRTLLLVDGMRVPLTGVYYDGYDPSIIAPLSVQRVDLLPSGASSTYGSDAIAGVINVILRRRYDGAISQASYQHVQGGAGKWQVGQLYGTTWDTGDVTVSFDYVDEEALHSDQRSYITWDFIPYGHENRRPLRSSVPGTVSFGPVLAGANRPNSGRATLPNQTANPIGFAGSGCTNCLLVPGGQNGTGLTWATLTGNPMVPQTLTDRVGRNNIIDPHKYSEYLGQQQRAAAAITFDQEIWDGVELFVDGYYYNRRNILHASPAVNPWPGGTIDGFIVPTNNPYYPAGTPANQVIRIYYSTVLDGLDLQHKAKETSGRWAAGFNIDLPREWQGRLSYSITEGMNRADIVNTANSNNILAALGNIVGDPDGVTAPYMIGTAPRTITADDKALNPVLNVYPTGTGVRVISPSNIPFFNPFCDPTAFDCQDSRTINFVRAHWIDQADYQVQQWVAQADGPVFDLPGGALRAAVGMNYVTDGLAAMADRNQALATAEVTKPIFDYFNRSVWAVFGQVNIPVFSEENRMPLFEALTIEGGARYDKYDDFGSTFNPEVSVDWEPYPGFQFNGTWGNSFSAPPFGNLGNLASKNTSPTNTAAGALTDVNTSRLCTAAQIAANSAPTSGSVAAVILSAIGAPTCADAAITSALAALPAGHLYAGYTLNDIRFPGILSQNGGAAPAFGVVRPPGTLSPEESENYSLGFNFNPLFIPGLNIQASYWYVRINNNLGGISPDGDAINDPLPRTTRTVKGGDATNPAAPFDVALAAYLASPALASGVTPKARTISVVNDGMIGNNIFTMSRGVDFSASYDWEMGAWGSWSVSVTGRYLLCGKSQARTDTPITDGCKDLTPNSWGVVGNGGGNRMGNARGQIGWQGTEMGWQAGWNAAFSADYEPHYWNNEVPPAALVTEVVTGLPISATNPVLTGDALLKANQAHALIPEQYFFNLSIGYETGDRPTNTYLRNLDFRLTVNDILDRNPPYFHRTANAGAGPVAFDPTAYNPTGRVISFSITKNW